MGVRDADSEQIDFVVFTFALKARANQLELESIKAAPASWELSSPSSFVRVGRRPASRKGKTRDGGTRRETQAWAAMLVTVVSCLDPDPDSDWHCN